MLANKLLYWPFSASQDADNCQELAGLTIESSFVYVLICLSLDPLASMDLGPLGILCIINCIKAQPICGDVCQYICIHESISVLLYKNKIKVRFLKVFSTQITLY